MTRQNRHLSIKEAAIHFQVSERTIHRRIKSRQLNAKKVNGQWVVEVCLDTVDSYLDNVDETGKTDVELENLFVNSVPTKVDLSSQVADLTRQIEQGEVERKHLTELLEEKTRENRRLYETISRRDDELNHAHQLLGLAQKNVSVLAEQLDTSRAVIEDLRNRKPFWKRLLRR